MNKFGFDKIILVADYRNIKSIFHHKYGEGTDFDGYFDKFFSVKVFEFNNTQIILDVVNQIVASLNLISDRGELFHVDPINGNILALFLKIILVESLNVKKLNLRQLLKGTKFPLNHREEHFNILANKQIGFIDQIDYAIKILIVIFDGQESNFLSVINSVKTKLNNEKDDDEQYYKTFARPLFLKIQNKKDLGQSTHVWREYTIKCANNRIESVKKQRRGSVSAKMLFFELLIEYTNKQYYLKNNAV